MNGNSMLLRVVRIRQQAADIRSFELARTDGAPLPGFSGGAHVEIATPAGLLRQYSLCNDPAERHRYLIAVLREPSSRGGSAWMHEALREGDQVRVSEPRNLFPLAPDASRSVLIAGGIGITPVLAMSRQLAVAGAPFELHYCAKSPAHAAFHDELATAEWRERVHFHYSQQGGRASLAEALAPRESGAHLYVCGPKSLIDAVLAAARANGWPEDALHREFFANEVACGDNGASFRVRLAKSGQIVEVPGGKTVVQALEEEGVCVPVSCGEGICGTCVTRVLDGTPDHKDLFLSAAEQAANDRFTPCCSRAKSPMLVLDL